MMAMVPKSFSFEEFPGDLQCGLRAASRLLSAHIESLGSKAPPALQKIAKDAPVSESRHDSMKALLDWAFDKYGPRSKYEIRDLARTLRDVCSHSSRLCELLSADMSMTAEEVQQCVPRGLLCCAVHQEALETCEHISSAAKSMYLSAESANVVAFRTSSWNLKEERRSVRADLSFQMSDLPWNLTVLGSWAEFVADMAKAPSSHIAIALRKTREMRWDPCPSGAGHEATEAVIALHLGSADWE